MIALKPLLLFIVPTIPSSKGHGTSMRLYAILTTLTDHYDVSVLNLNTYRPRRFNDEVHGLPSGNRVVMHRCTTTPADLPFRDRAFSVIFVARLISWNIAKLYLDAPVNRHALRILDCDDYESRTRDSFSRLALSAGLLKRARSEAAAAHLFEKLERDALEHFNKILLSASSDVTLLRTRFKRLNFHYVPNAISVISPPSCGLRRVSTFLIVLVGTMDYYPNIDGAIFLCERIVPRLRAMLPRYKLAVLIIGSRPVAEVKQLSRIPGVSVTGEMENLDAIYASADLAVVPLRAGGGSRLKILEAFAYGCPVVSTRIGAAGLDVKNGEELLLADDVASFALACTRLLLDHLLRMRLQCKSREWVKTNHSVAVVRCALSAAGILPEVRGAGQV